MNFELKNNESKFLIRLADTATILGQRLAEMCSKARIFHWIYSVVQKSYIKLFAH
jgi:hypothetical protein